MSVVLIPCSIGHILGQNIPALYGAPVKTSTSLPVIMFSHGVSGMRTFCSAICCDLASHGYLIAAIEHRCSMNCKLACIMGNVQCSLALLGPRHVQIIKRFS